MIATSGPSSSRIPPGRPLLVACIARKRRIRRILSKPRAGFYALAQPQVSMRLCNIAVRRRADSHVHAEEAEYYGRTIRLFEGFLGDW